ncbi:Gfo/Idh/MocA family oxidoreductase [Parapedobacter sp. ISTM3]|uniref:Predicted dehydrogenase n=1 Tax=Parapedobacter luteus TaxID=623280 RepID=A0A1T5BJI0_9SPHI|nr:MULTISPECIES: Gfo/Idh/MocA family oxidoreductase [Parapedobacter]MBK1439468.1 Gfo/Idh/MocA family oxidoreductase [Parapedobacter sp. ISTM3]SKB47169.1 Predicted dehydrogenase [Parapedobacter luteus]
MSKKSIVTGILSYGMSGRVFHAPFIHEKSRFELRAVVERHEKRAHQRYPSVISYNSVEELLNDEKIELVIVNTPNDTHVDYATQALKAGKHILVEKPFAPNSDDARRLFNLSKEVGKHVMVFQNRRWDSDFKLLKRVVERQTLGELIELHVRFDRYRMEKSPKTFKEQKIPGSGVLYDLGPHLLDQVISLFGKPEKSIKIVSSHRPGSEVDDFSTLVLTYPKGFTVFIHASLLVANPLPAYVLHGTKGSFQKVRADVQEDQLQGGISPKDPGYGIEPPGKEGLITLIKPNGDREMRYREALKGDYNDLFNAVYAQIRKGEPFPVKPEEILWQMEILEQPAWNG